MSTAHTPRFAMTYCSQCGCEQGPGNEGVSHCSKHMTPAIEKVRFDLLMALIDLKRALWVAEDNDQESINLNHVWTHIGHLDKAFKELQAATGAKT